MEPGAHDEPLGEDDPAKELARWESVLILSPSPFTASIAHLLNRLIPEGGRARAERGRVAPTT